MSVFNGERPLTFRRCRDTYVWYNTFDEKVKAINTAWDITSGGHVVAIDRYPLTRFREGARLTEGSQWTYYDFEVSDFENAGCPCMVLSLPGQKPMLLSELRFACDARGVEGYTPEAIVFHKDAVLSVRCPFGDISGIALTHYREHALAPESNTLVWTMRFEKLSFPAVLLETRKP